MKAGIITFPGSNCDRDVIGALRRVWRKVPIIIHHKETQIPPLDLIIIPGGFSYGDYLRSGALAARTPVMTALKEHAQKGGAILGICNGFQILTEAGLLPGALIANKRLRFISRLIRLEVTNKESIFTRLYKKNEIITLPIANGMGAYTAPPDIVKSLEDNDQIAFRYTEDINGSVQKIAGIFDATKRILGLMPHPERRCEALTGGLEGVPLFRSLLAV